MDRSGFSEKTQALRQKISGFGGKVTAFFRNLGHRAPGDPAPKAEKTDAATPLAKAMAVVRNICKWIYRLRRFFMAAPVVYYALKLAAYCRAQLPEQVGLNLLSSGEFSQMVDRSLAINSCLIITFASLALMFVSRRARYPWVISIFTLVLPLLLLVTNIYPQ